MCPRSLRRRRGFTLVELVITLGITGLMLATGVPAFRSYGRVVQFDSQADIIASALDQARTLSLAPESDKPSSVVAYGVVIDAITRKVEVGRFSDAVSPRLVSVVQARTLSPEVTITKAPSGPVIFPIQLQGEPTVPGGKVENIVLTHSQLRDRATRVIAIQPITGQVSIE